jgi:hypothetical protein
MEFMHSYKFFNFAWEFLTTPIFLPVLGQMTLKFILVKNPVMGASRQNPCLASRQHFCCLGLASVSSCLASSSPRPRENCPGPTTVKISPLKGTTLNQNAAFELLNTAIGQLVWAVGALQKKNGKKEKNGDRHKNWVPSI